MKCPAIDATNMGLALVDIPGSTVRVTTPGSATHRSSTQRDTVTVHPERVKSLWFNEPKRLQKTKATRSRNHDGKQCPQYSYRG